MASSFKYPTGAHYLQIKGQRSIPPASVHTSLIKCIDPCCHTHSSTRTRTSRQTHTRAHTRTSYLCCSRTEKVSIYIQLFCPLGLLRVNSLQLWPASALEVAPSIRARACRSLSASPSIQQSPYSRHLHILIMQNANAVVFLILTRTACTLGT